MSTVLFWQNSNNGGLLLTQWPIKLTTGLNAANWKQAEQGEAGRGFAVSGGLKYVILSQNSTNEAGALQIGLLINETQSPRRWAFVHFYKSKLKDFI